MAKRACETGGIDFSYEKEPPNESILVNNQTSDVHSFSITFDNINFDKKARDSHFDVVQGMAVGDSVRSHPKQHLSKGYFGFERGRVASKWCWVQWLYQNARWSSHYTKDHLLPYEIFQEKFHFKLGSWADSPNILKGNGQEIRNCK